jgi:hypothetical protein
VLICFQFVISRCMSVKWLAYSSQYLSVSSGARYFSCCEYIEIGCGAICPLA